ncbi:hypothetical protein MNV49_004225 [Pseudohyphozyma bogoriensis]|nr:hypothetical protein MNV49_004225 [Pseudohyphozyma bogoriensis]
MERPGQARMPFKNFKTYLSQRSAETSDSKSSAYADKVAREEERRWGPPAGDGIIDERSTRGVVQRYQKSMGIHRLANADNPDYLKYLKRGYFEPVPQITLISPLAAPPINKLNFYKNAAEERLYYVLNNAVDVDADGVTKPKPPKMRPDKVSAVIMAQKRMRTAELIDPSFASDSDVFLSNKSFRKKGYSRQVRPLEISHAFQELFENQMKAREVGGQGHQTDEVDVMIMLDVSGSMGTIHPFPFAQPRHAAKQQLSQRAIHHMEVRDSYASQGGAGHMLIVPSSSQLNWNNFDTKWKDVWTLIEKRGPTRVMAGWKKVREAHFVKHGGGGKAWKDPVYGWQAGPNMAKLSLLVLLDGEAYDMDEFELELLGEKWAYITICLVGREDFSDHHRHANELTRIAQANDHINFLDVQGRISERLVVSNVLQRVYASSAPSYNEIMDPRFDLPSYSALAE